MQHYDITRAEKFGSRERSDTSIDACPHCKRVVDKAYDEACRDFAGQLFCSEDCFKDYYGFRRVAV